MRKSPPLACLVERVLDQLDVLHDFVLGHSVVLLEVGLALGGHVGAKDVFRRLCFVLGNVKVEGAWAQSLPAPEVVQEFPLALGLELVGTSVTHAGVRNHLRVRVVL